MKKSNLKSELKKALENSSHNIKLHEKFKHFKDRNIIIYGAGYAGRHACDILTNNNYIPLCFFDEKGEALGSYAGIPVKTLESSELSSEQIENSTVIFSALTNSETEKTIIHRLNALGYENIIPYKQKAFSHDFIFRNKVPFYEPLVESYQHEILSCFDLFSDEESIHTFKSIMTAFALRSFEHLSHISDEEQYFPKDIKLHKGYTRFVDCGAFDGDTIRKLVAIKGIPQAVFAFEPSQSNFCGLCKTIDNTGINNCCLFPCGVFSETKMLRFAYDNAYSGLAGSLDSYGNDMIQCVALDDVLKDVLPTFIKMDIEGAEYDALMGAERVIRSCKPDLAISVYHYLNHYFEIPLLIDGWNLGYRFYLRTYDKCGNETVLYCSCER